MVERAETKLNPALFSMAELLESVTSGDLCRPRHDVPNVHLLALVAGQIVVQRSTAGVLCGEKTWTQDREDPLRGPCPCV